MTTFDERKAKIRALDPDEARSLLILLAGLYPDAYDSVEAALIQARGEVER